MITDPAWYPDHAKSFVWAASRLCVEGGHLLRSVAPEGTRPGLREETADLLEWADRCGFDLIDMERGVLPYNSPAFEQNAFAAGGIRGIPRDWRRGNLAIFVHARINKVRRSPSRYRRGPEWKEVLAAGVRFRIRMDGTNEPSTFTDPRLVPVVHGSVLASVSRRDPMRQKVEVWTLDLW
ncbi:MAG: hypothetical protein ACLQVD_02240 [Capsulimonadaceae bacterium]